VELIKGKLMSKQSRKNRESIRDVTAELQIKFIWSTLGAFILFLMVEIPTPKPYIFMIRVTRQIKCLIAQAPGRGVIPHPLPEVNFLMVECEKLTDDGRQVMAKAHIAIGKVS
jgi:hypothetical protein